MSHGMMICKFQEKLARDRRPDSQYSCSENLATPRLHSGPVAKRYRVPANLQIWKEKEKKSADDGQKSTKTGPNLHRVRRFIPAQRARQVTLDLALRVAAVLFAELHADAGGAFALRAFRGHPDDAAGDR